MCTCFKCNLYFDYNSACFLCLTFIQNKLFPQAISYLEKTFQVRRPAGTILLSRYVTLNTDYLVLCPPHFNSMENYEIYTRIFYYDFFKDQNTSYFKNNIIQKHLLDNYSFPDFLIYSDLLGFFLGCSCPLLGTSPFSLLLCLQYWFCEIFGYLKTQIRRISHETNFFFQSTFLTNIVTFSELIQLLLVFYDVFDCCELFPPLSPFSFSFWQLNFDVQMN